MISSESSSSTLEKELQTGDTQPKSAATNFSVKFEEYTENLELLVKKQRKQLKETERLAAIGQTAGMVSHDIRNPLQAIISELFLAKEECKKIPDAKGLEAIVDSITFIEEQIEYINKIVSDLQDYAQTNQT